MKIAERMLIALAILVAIIGSFGDKARAHDWYPMECCHAMDCAPVDKVEMLQGPAMASMLGTATSTPIASSMLVTSKHGTVIIPANFPRRESKDHRMHVCMRPGEGGNMRLIC